MEAAKSPLRALYLIKFARTDLLAFDAAHYEWHRLMGVVPVLDRGRVVTRHTHHRVKRLISQASEETADSLVRLLQLGDFDL